MEFSASGIDVLANLEQNKSIVRMAEDVKLKSINFGDYDTIEALVWHIAMKGTQVQRMAIANNFTIQSCKAFPSLKSSVNSFDDGWKFAIDFICSELSNLADFFGTEVKGDIGSIAWTIFDNYSHLTVVDFIKFFSACKLGQFKEPYQHISVRGINSEFVIDWLNKYLDTRAEIFEALIIEARQINNFELSSEITEKLASERMKAQVRESILQSRERELRDELEAQESKKSGFQKLFEFLCQEVFFIQCSDCKIEDVKEKALELANYYTGIWINEFKTVSEDAEELKKYCFSQSKKLQSKFKEQFNMSPQKYISDLIMTFVKEKDIEDCEMLVAILFGDNDAHIKNKTDFIPIVFSIASSACQVFENDFKKYREKLLDRDELPLSKKDYIMRRARIFCFKTMSADAAKLLNK